MITGHGGNVKSLAQRSGCPINEIIDMSCNLNPLGPPSGLEDYLMENIREIRSLPEPDAGEMVRKFAGYHDIDHKRVMAGNGTTSFIYTIPAALKSKHLLIAGPSYADYRDGCIMHNTAFSFCLAEKKLLFQPDLSKISELISDKKNEIDTVIICNPNNPTGTLVQKSNIIELLEKHPDTFFVIDESYLPFVDNAEEISLTAETGFPNLMVLSSMSKIFRIPGLRTGFLSAHPDIVENFMKYYQPWSVNALAQAAVIYLLENRDKTDSFIKKSRKFIKKEKQLFYDSLSSCSGIRLFASETYFIIAELLNDITADKVCRIVGDEKILIRNCANFHGLSDRFVRFSLKERKINMKLAGILKKIEEIK